MTALTSARALLAATATVAAVSTWACDAPPRAVSELLDSFETHPIVALGEGLHGNEQAHAFRLALIKDPRFPLVVNDIVVEFGTSRYQHVMDAFVHAENVPATELRNAWRDSTQAGPIWDVPIYEEFFRTVRTVNAGLPKDRRLRLLLADPPIEWENVRTPQDWIAWNSRRVVHAANLIRTEVLQPRRRALMVFGDGHHQRRREGAFDADMKPIMTLRNRIEQDDPGSVFSIWTNTTVPTGTPRPAAHLTGRFRTSFPRAKPAFGRLNFSAFAGIPSKLRMQDQYDAILHLGPPSSITMSELPVDLCPGMRTT